MTVQQAGQNQQDKVSPFTRRGIQSSTGIIQVKTIVMNQGYDTNFS